ncbi:hypothetical protein D3C87_1560080 [compost metagenome]
MRSSNVNFAIPDTGGSGVSSAAAKPDALCAISYSPPLWGAASSGHTHDPLYSDYFLFRGYRRSGSEAARNRAGNVVLTHVIAPRQAQGCELQRVPLRTYLSARRKP